MKKNLIRLGIVLALGKLALAGMPPVKVQGQGYVSSPKLNVIQADQVNLGSHVTGTLPLSSLGTVTADRALQSNGSGEISASSVTATELGHVSGVSSSLCGINQTCTLTNKTLTAPVISTISNTGTLTLPTSTDTLVGRATTDTLTNKTISGADNTLSNIPNSATTATNANTANAIVARDASGNFSAGTITADLNGNAATATTASTVTTNANLTGPITSVGNATSVASQTGTGSTFVMSAGPTITGTLGADTITASGNITGANLSGTNSGDVTLGAVGSSPNANGASLTGQALTLQPADATNPGVVSTGTQTLAGAKTFSGNVAVQGSTTLNTGLTGVLKGSSGVVSAGSVDLASEVTGALPIANGGTGQTGQTAAFNALSPNTTKGDITIHNGTNNVRVGVPGDYGALVPDTAASSGWRSVDYKTAGKPQKNYIQYHDIENNVTTGFTVGTAAITSGLPTGAPSFGENPGITPTISSTSSTPLSGAYSLNAEFVAGAAAPFVTTQAYTIDKADQAKVLSFKFSYEVASGTVNMSGTSSNSFGVAIYDVTNSAWIIPAGVWNLVQSSGVGIAQGTFQTPSNMTQFRLVVYQANSIAGAVTLKLDDFYVGPQSLAFGPAVSDWIPFSMSITASVSNPTKASSPIIDAAYWRRVGDSMEIQYDYRGGATGAAAGNGTYYFNLPSGYTIDSTKIGSFNGTTNPTFGTCTVNPQVTLGVVGADNATSLTLRVITSGTPSYGFVGSSLYPLNGADTRYSFTAKVPISGWSSNTVFSSDSETRVVAMRASGDPASATAGNPIIFPNIDWDTHSTYNNVTGRYTSPVSGYLKVSGYVNNPSAGIALAIYKDGVLDSYIGTTDSFGNATLGGMVRVNAGQIIDVRPTSTINVASNSYLIIERVSGPATVAASESVNLSAKVASGSLGAAYNLVTFTTKDYDSHNNYSSGIYTIAIAGKYRISSSIVVSATRVAGNTLYLQIYKNNSTVVGEGLNASNASFTGNLTASVNRTVDLLPGDTIRIRSYSEGTGSAFAGGGDFNFLNIERVGN